MSGGTGMRYYEFKQINNKRIHDLPIHYAFGQAAFEAKLVELGVTVEDVVAMPAGGFMLKKDKHLFAEAALACKKAEDEYFADDNNLLDALEHELANHEYCVNYDADDALAALGLSHKDKRVQRLLPQAIDNYLANVIC